MKKRLKKYGNTAVIVFTKEDLDISGWKIGDIIDLSDAVKVAEVNKKERKKVKNK